VGYYPVALDLTARPVLVVGGGPVAARKVEGLLAAAARVTVVSPTLVPALAALARAGRLRHRARRFRPGDLRGVALAFAASGDPAVDAAVAAAARRRGVWVNVADDPARCDVILPSVLRRGDLQIAVTTGGASPALARAVRLELERLVPAEYAELVALVGEVRRALRARGASPPPETWRRALAGDLRALLAAGRRAEARRALCARLGVG